MPNCLLCDSEGIRLTEHNMETELFACPNCKTHFSRHVQAASYENYEVLYPGMQQWCQDLKALPNPWRTVSNRGMPYAAIMQYFMNQDQKLNVLDVGCGWGYVVWVLNQLGFKARGLDISREAISFALQTFGNHYDFCEIQNYLDKHDIIVAIEVIEHVAKPKEWLQQCLVIAPRVMLTTPNLSAYNTAWISEPPPVHLACYRKESLEWLANELKVKVTVNDSGPNLVATYES